MIWLSPTSFKSPRGASRLAVAALSLTLLISTIQAATVSGAVSIPGRKDSSGVVVYAIPANGAAPLAPSKHAVMLQKNKTFSPHLLPIVVGTMVDFPNADPIFHNAFSSFNGQIFDLSLYPPGTSRSVRFARPGVVRVFCNIHPTMSAVILVLNTDYFAQSARDGSFTLAMPPGDYTLSFFHERSTEKTLAALSQKISLPAEGLKLAPVEVSEAGFIPVPHKNKYGKDYPPPPDDQIVYPGVRN